MRCKILKDFNGSQDGTVTVQFTAGTTVEMSEYLMGCADKSWFEPADESWFEPADETPPAIMPVIDNKAIASDGSKPKRK